MAHIVFDKYITPAQRQAVNLLASYGRTSGIAIHLFGGFVRDVVRGAVPKDVDVRMDVPDLEEAGREFAKWLGGRCVGVYCDPRIVSVTVRTGQGEVTVDLTRQEGAGIYEDAMTHDLTINAMAVNIHDVANGRAARVIDLAGGMRDIEAGIVRMVRPESFSDDPVRVLRALRFSHTLGYRIEPHTMAAVRANAPMLSESPGERSRAELAKFLSVPPYDAAVRLMEETGVLGQVFPEVEACRGVAQPSMYHVHDVYGHLLKTVEELDRLVGEHGVPFGPEAVRYFDEPVGDGLTRRDLMPFAALFHDIGKPGTVSARPAGNPRFLLHERVGADMVAAICARLKFSRPVRVFLTSVVRNHMRPWSIAPEGRAPSVRAIRKFHQQVGNAAVAVLVLHLADLRGARGYMLTTEEWDARVALVGRIIAGVRDQEALAAEPPLLTGHDVMALGVPQGPEIGRLLRLVAEARAVGAISSREEAVRLVESDRSEEGETE